MAVNAVPISSTYGANHSTGFASLHIQGANATFQITANSTGGNSSIGNPPSADFILGASIMGLTWSTDGVINVSRGANVVATLTGSDIWNESMGWKGIDLYKGAANLNVTMTSPNTVLMIDLKKVYN